MRMAVESLRRATGSAPVGWYTGRDSPNTRRLVVEHGGFLYDSDYYGDDLPFWTAVTTADGRSHPHLIVPYTLDANDMRFATASGFANGTILLIVVAFLVARAVVKCGLGERIGYAVVSLFGRSTLGLSYSVFLIDGVDPDHVATDVLRTK